MCLLFRILLLVSYLSTLCLSKIFSIFSKVCCLFVYLSNLYTQGEAQTYNPEIIITTFTDWARQTPQCWFKSVLFLYLDLWSTLCLSLQLRPRSFFFFLHKMSSCFNTICWKIYPLSSEWPSYLCKEVNHPYWSGSIRGSVFSSIDLSPPPHWLQCYNFKVSFEIKYSDAHTFILLFLHSLSCSSLSIFVYKFENQLIYIYKKSCWDFDCNCS